MYLGTMCELAYLNGTVLIILNAPSRFSQECCRYSGEAPDASLLGGHDASDPSADAGKIGWLSLKRFQKYFDVETKVCSALFYPILCG